jgi:hypothetical protein
MEVGVKGSLQKKTYNLDAAVIERVRRLFDAKTDSEAIRRALEKAIEDREIQGALEQLLKKGRFRSVYR